MYDREPADPKWVVEVDTTSLTRREVEDAVKTPRVQPSGSVKKVLWVGRFSKNKNTDLLLRVVKRLRRRLREMQVTLHLVGDGDLLDSTISAARALHLESAVTFYGRLPWASLRNLYASCDVLVLPSSTEGFPKVTHEAMLFGTPVVAFAVGALPRILAGRGIAVDPGEGETGFEQAMAELLTDATRWAKLSDESRRWAASLSIEDVVAQYRELCEDEWGLRLGSGVSFAEQ